MFVWGGVCACHSMDADVRVKFRGVGCLLPVMIKLIKLKEDFSRFHGR